MAVRPRKPSPACKDEQNDQVTTRNDTSDHVETPLLTLDEKIAAIDQEIRTIHHFFVAKGFTPLEIERGAQPLFNGLNKANKRRLAITVLKVAVLLLVAYGVVRSDWTYDMVLTYGRVGLVKVSLVS
jgi:hypothetical protein